MSAVVVGVGRSAELATRRLSVLAGGALPYASCVLEASLPKSSEIADYSHHLVAALETARTRRSRTATPVYLILDATSLAVTQGARDLVVGIRGVIADRKLRTHLHVVVVLPSETAAKTDLAAAYAMVAGLHIAQRAGGGAVLTGLDLLGGPTGRRTHTGPLYDQLWFTSGHTPLAAALRTSEWLFTRLERQVGEPHPAAAEQFSEFGVWLGGGPPARARALAAQIDEQLRRDAAKLVVAQPGSPLRPSGLAAQYELAAKQVTVSVDARRSAIKASMKAATKSHDFWSRLQGVADDLLTPVDESAAPDVYQAWSEAGQTDRLPQLSGLARLVEDRRGRLAEAVAAVRDRIRELEDYERDGAYGSPRGLKWAGRGAAVDLLVEIVPVRFDQEAYSQIATRFANLQHLVDVEAYCVALDRALHDDASSATPTVVEETPELDEWLGASAGGGDDRLVEKVERGGPNAGVVGPAAAGSGAAFAEGGLALGRPLDPAALAWWLTVGANLDGSALKQVAKLRNASIAVGSRTDAVGIVVETCAPVGASSTFARLRDAFFECLANDALPPSAMQDEALLAANLILPIEEHEVSSRANLLDDFAKAIVLGVLVVDPEGAVRLQTRTGRRIFSGVVAAFNVFAGNPEVQKALLDQLPASRRQFNAAGLNEKLSILVRELQGGLLRGLYDEVQGARQGKAPAATAEERRLAKGIDQWSRQIAGSAPHRVLT